MEIRAIQQRVPARHDLVLLAVALVALSRFLQGPLIWLLAALLLGAMLLGTLQVLGEGDGVGESAGVPIESLLTPSVAAVAALGAIRFVPIGMWLIPALAAAGWLINRTIATETRILASPHGPSSRDRSTLLVEALVVAFVGFSGAAVLVPGGLAEPGAPGAPTSPLPEPELLLLVAADAVIAGLLGYRASALRVTNLRDALWSAATYATAIAIGAAALRAMAIPRLVGPALLTLTFFLWDAFHGAPPSRRRDPRWIWQTVLLIILGIVVAAWNIRLR